VRVTTFTRRVTTPTRAISALAGSVAIGLSSGETTTTLAQPRTGDSSTAGPLCQSTAHGTSAGDSTAGTQLLETPTVGSWTVWIGHDLPVDLDRNSSGLQHSRRSRPMPFLRSRFHCYWRRRGASMPVTWTKRSGISRLAASSRAYRTASRSAGDPSTPTDNFRVCFVVRVDSPLAAARCGRLST
jgi:hypothetical protein